MSKVLLAAYRKARNHPETNAPLLPDETAVLAQQAVLKGTLSDVERFDIYEQMFMAALELNDHTLAKSYLDLIVEKFPGNKSCRSSTLSGMYHQGLKEYKVAMEFYDRALGIDECYVLAMKKKISCLIDQDKIQEAVKKLVEYVDIYMQDTEAWAQLAKLYTLHGKYAEAAFCMEELLIHSPQDPFYQTRYADLQVLNGELMIAIKYYCYTIKHCEDHTRSLYGLHHATKLCLEKIKKGVTIKSQIPLIAQDILEELYDLSKERIAAIYAKDEFRDRGLEAVIKKWLQIKT
jgi:tetratricopeptide (TPR) repeat protein